MKLIADSGSSKTAWRIIRANGKIEQLKTSGINPFLASEEQILQKLHAEVPLTIPETVEAIYFYGAGCSNEINREKLRNVLQRHFECSEVHVAHDLLAAARATCGTTPGIACILGTGANACLYDGKTISQQMVSLGYTIGDEGSGNYIGKLCLKAYLEGEMPKTLADEFKKQFPGINLDISLQKIYTEPYPNRFFASFFEFALQHQKSEFFLYLIVEAFQKFLEKSVLKFENSRKLPINFVGGVAFHAQNIMRKVLQDNSLHAGIFIEDPIAGLTLYHQNN